MLKKLPILGLLLFVCSMPVAYAKVIIGGDVETIIDGVSDRSIAASNVTYEANGVSNAHAALDAVYAADTSEQSARQSADGVHTTSINRNRTSISGLQDNVLALQFQVIENDDRLWEGWVDSYGDVFNNTNDHILPSTVTGFVWSAAKYMSPNVPSSDDLGTALAFHVKANDDAASTAVDESSATDQDGVSDNNTADMSEAGKIGKAFHIDPDVTDKIDFGDHADWDNITSGTWAFWVKFDNLAAGTAHRLWSKWDGGGNRAWYHSIDNGYDRFSFQCGDGGQRYDTANSSISGDDTWHHVAYTYDGGANVISGYVNGVYSAPGYTSGTPLDSIPAETAELWVGQFDSHTGYEHDGHLDDLRFYKNRVLTVTEIQALYNGGDGTESVATGGASTTPCNMQIADSDWYLLQDSDSVRLSVVMLTNSAAIVNSSFWFEVSANDGTNWTRVDVVNKGYFTTSPTTEVWRGESTNLTVGTTPRFRVTGTNLVDDAFRIYAIGGLFDRRGQ
jgi:hypothetical protein